MKNETRFLCIAMLAISAVLLSAPVLAQQQLVARIGSQRTVILDFTDTNVTDQEIEYINQTYTTDTTPDSFWYVFKRFGEGFRLFFTFDPSEKVKLHLRFAHERLAEAKHMAEKGEHGRAMLLIREYENEVNETNRGLKGIGKNVSVIARETEDVFLKSVYVLQLVYEKVPDSAKPAIERAINNSLTKKAETEGLEHNWTREQLREKIEEEMEKHEQRWIRMQEKFEEKLQEKLAEIDERIEEAMAKNQTEKVKNLQQLREQINESIGKKLRHIEEKREEFWERFQKKLERLNRTEEPEENETEEEEEITGNVLVNLDKTNYTTNETITITVKNNLSEELYYGGCGSFRHKRITIENKINETWSEANGTQDWFVCLLAVEQQPTELDEGNSITFSTIE